jgi:uncharacterized protein (TIGR02452 family)
MSRLERAAIARETQAIVAAGRYERDGRTVDIAASVAAARRGSHLHLPDDPALDLAPAAAGAGSVEVTGETTLQAAARLAADGHTDVAALNFASAYKPGGGYLNGAEAQEEALARASALAECLVAVPEFYEFHRRQQDPCYSDRVVCSPAVPVFRDDAGTLLAQPHEVTFLTAAAPNAGALADQGRSADLRSLVRRRAGQVLAAAVLHDQRALILGAWGCGVFRNDPVVVADVFAGLLVDGFAGAFDRVTFAVLDRAPDAPTRGAFADRLGPLTA